MQSYRLIDRPSRRNSGDAYLGFKGTLNKLAPVQEENTRSARDKGSGIQEGKRGVYFLPYIRRPPVRFPAQAHVPQSATPCSWGYPKEQSALSLLSGREEGTREGTREGT